MQMLKVDSSQLHKWKRWETKFTLFWKSTASKIIQRNQVDLLSYFFDCQLFVLLDSNVWSIYSSSNLLVTRRLTTFYFHFLKLQVTRKFYSHYYSHHYCYILLAFLSLSISPFPLFLTFTLLLHLQRASILYLKSNRMFGEKNLSTPFHRWLLMETETMAKAKTQLTKLNMSDAHMEEWEEKTYE